MSKRTRDIMILVLLAVVLIAVIMVVNGNASDTTAGIRDIVNTR